MCLCVCHCCSARSRVGDGGVGGGGAIKRQFYQRNCSLGKHRMEDLAHGWRLGWNGWCVVRQV